MTNWPPLWPQVQPLLKTLNWSTEQTVECRRVAFLANELELINLKFEMIFSKFTTSTSKMMEDDLTYDQIFFSWTDVEPNWRPIGHRALARSFLSGVTTEEKQKCLFFGPASIHEKKFGRRWGRLPSFWRLTSWILKKIISNFKLINSNSFAKNATLIHSTVCSVDQFKVFNLRPKWRPIGHWALARSFFSGVTTEEKQKCLFFGPTSIHEKKIWS